MAEVTSFLREKWSQAFHFLDTNRDGELTEADFAAIADYMAKKTNATPEQAKNSKYEWIKWFEYLKPNPSVKVDEERYVASCEELYRQDVENHRRLLRGTGSDLFDRLDLDGDGKISFAEYAMFYEAVGIRERAAAKSSFKNVDTNGDGIVEREELIADIVRHFTDPYPTTGRSYIFIKPEN